MDCNNYLGETSVMPFSDQFLDQAFNGGGNPMITLMRVAFEGQTFYFANNNESITSNVSGSSQLYQKSRFDLQLPDDTEEGTPRATLNFEAADIQIVRALRETNEVLVIDIWIVLGSNPNVAEFGPANYQSAAFNIDESAISIELEVEPVLHVQIPRDRFTPNIFPGLFEGVQ